MVKPLARIVNLLMPKRRWTQFSLFTMFIVVTVFCVWLSVVVNRAHRQRDAVAAIKALGGTVGYEESDQKASKAFPTQFLRRWLPRDYFDEVRVVLLGGTQVTDAGLAHVQGLTALLLLNLDGTQVTDAGLAELQDLTALQTLHLGGTQVTDAGLADLQALTGLKWLELSDTQLTDAGLAHLHGLTKLRSVELGGTQVTEAGRAELRQVLPNLEE